MFRPSPPRQSGILDLLEHLIPGVRMLRGYRGEWLRPDVQAGVVVCLVMIPSVIAYANLLGVSPQYGLCAAFVALLVYPFLGSSRQVIVGPDIAVTLLIAAAVVPIAGGDPARAAALTAEVTVLSGLLLILGARLRMDVVADFLSKPVLVGYMSGAALVLVASQLDVLFGVSLRQREFFLRLIELGYTLSHMHAPTLALGTGLLALLFLLQRFVPRVPGALVVFVIALGVSFVVNPADYGIAAVGSFPGGLPRFSFPGDALGHIQALLPAALGVALLSYTEGLLLARAFAVKNGYEVDAKRELVALGVADVAAGFFQGFAVTGSQARTTINDAAGGKTQVTSLVAAGTPGAVSPVLYALDCAGPAGGAFGHSYPCRPWVGGIRCSEADSPALPACSAHGPADHGRRPGRGSGPRHSYRHHGLTYRHDQPRVPPTRRSPSTRAGARLS